MALLEGHADQLTERDWAAGHLALMGSPPTREAIAERRKRLNAKVFKAARQIGKTETQQAYMKASLGIDWEAEQKAILEEEQLVAKLQAEAEAQREKP